MLKPSIILNPGTYVIAVSGGVDSMVLLDLLKDRPKTELIVAHFNHGIRTESSADENLVAETAEKLGLKLEAGKGSLGPKASEATARKARYEFLRKIQRKHQADKILTAHHQDDLIETALINLLRGSGRKGLVSMILNPDIQRPLLGTPKKDILAYAAVKKLRWREDSSNEDIDYLRNYLRKKVLPNLTDTQRQELIINIEKVAKIDLATNSIIATISHSIYKNGKIDRTSFNNLPLEVAGELVIHWLRSHGFKGYDKKMVNRLCMAVKTGKSGSKIIISPELVIHLTKDQAIFKAEAK